MVFQNRDSFVTILIDGDGMIVRTHLARLYTYVNALQFNEKVLQAAENGGHSAAKFLYDSVRAQIAETMPNLPPDVKIVVRVYANLKGLAEAAFRSGLVENPAFVEDFLRGFTANNPLFDFVDVGPRRDRTLIKISGKFNSCCFFQSQINLVKNSFQL